MFLRDRVYTKDCTLWERFRNRPLEGNYPVIWVDALYEKVRLDGRVITMAIQVVCGINEEGLREVLALEPMLEESEESYRSLFQSMRKRGFCTPKLIILFFASIRVK